MSRGSTLRASWLCAVIPRLTSLWVRTSEYQLNFKQGDAATQTQLSDRRAKSAGNTDFYFLPHVSHKILSYSLAMREFIFSRRSWNFASAMAFIFASFCLFFFTRCLLAAQTPRPKMMNPRNTSNTMSHASMWKDALGCSVGTGMVR